MLRTVSAIGLSALLALGCGGAQSAPSGTTSVNLPESAWARAAIPEGGFSIDMPGTPARQVSTREDGETVQYVVGQEPLAFVVSIEALTGVVTPALEAAALDRVGALMVERSRDPQRACTPRPVRTIEHQGHAGRLFVGADCRALGDGAMSAAVFLHGRAVVSLVVVGAGLAEAQVEALGARVIESIAFGEAPSWFLPVDARVDVALLPGLSFAMPGAPSLETIQEEHGTTARYTSEPIRGLGTLVLVTRPATLPLAQYCELLQTSASLTMTERRDDVLPGSGVTYCEVRGRREADPNVIEIHDVLIASGAVIELVWVGPFSPSFVAGGDAQLRDIRASLQLPR
ncbi:hypothetical protein [Sandaracinus amylolyticus]|uniref:Lipoprotein n=1 Tax=Sandaracinus amylolyticus TaxID=927083 RepID=A0A0F6SDK1_9BACT|nr:hypothetical protein [Sandaracinus amylolyticus]AKF03584.1 hypothetical protein DB32_000733 [Sandaracinus amylolyticus]